MIVAILILVALLSAFAFRAGMEWEWSVTVIMSAGVTLTAYFCYIIYLVNQNAAS